MGSMAAAIRVSETGASPPATGENRGLRSKKPGGSELVT